MNAKADKPLLGRRVIVTRPSHQALALAAPLRELGAEVVLIPALEIAPPMDAEPLRAAVANLASYDWLVVTSVNGATALGRELRAQDVPLHGPLIAAVGVATAEALHRLDAATSRILPDNFNAEQLAIKLAPEVAGKRVLLVQGQSAATSLQDAIVAAGAHVERVDAYRSIAPAILPKMLGLWLLENKNADAVTFTSAQMALNFFRALEAKGAALPPQTVIASIGPVTSRALREIGHPSDVEAKSARMEDLAAALGQYFSE